MREIRFRAWSIKKSLLAKVLKLFIDDGGVFGATLDFGDSSSEDCFVKEFELMQYTGLKDKNGIEIYEGDVVKKYSDCNIEYHGEFCLYEVIFNNGGFILSYLQSETGQKLPRGYTAGFIADQTEVGQKLMLWSKDPMLIDEFEVIGNIYENP